VKQRGWWTDLQFVAMEVAWLESVATNLSKTRLLKNSWAENLMLLSFVIEMMAWIGSLVNHLLVI